MNVPGEKRETVLFTPIGQGPETVLLVEIHVSHGIAAFYLTLIDIQSQSLASGLLDFVQRRPKLDQRVVKIERDRFDHLLCCRPTQGGADPLANMETARKLTSNPRRLPKSNIPSQACES